MIGGLPLRIATLWAPHLVTAVNLDKPILAFRVVAGSYQGLRHSFFDDMPSINFVVLLTDPRSHFTRQWYMSLVVAKPATDLAAVWFATSEFAVDQG